MNEEDRDLLRLAAQGMSASAALAERLHRLADRLEAEQLPTEETIQCPNCGVIDVRGV